MTAPKEKDEPDPLAQLVSRWREEASEIAKQIRLGNYADHTSRVRLHMVVVTLRRCANALARQARKK